MEVKPDETIKLCPEMESLLELQSPYRFYEALAVADQKVQQAEGRRLILGDHSPEHISLHRHNLFEVLCLHFRPAPEIQPGTGPDVDQVEVVQVDEREEENTCRSCVTTFSTEYEYNRHVAFGPLAPGHMLESKARKNSFLYCLLILACLSGDGTYLLECAICDYTTNNRNSKHLFSHARTHARLFNEPTSDSEELTKSYVNTALTMISNREKHERLHACMECTAIFDSLTELYVHLRLVPHTTPVDTLCSLCGTRDHRDLLQHIERHHDHLLGERIVHWTPARTDDEVQDRVEEYIRRETQYTTYSPMESNVVYKTHRFSREVDLTPETEVDDGSIFPRQEVLFALPDSLQLYGRDISTVSLPNSHYDHSTRLALKVLPHPVPLALARDMSRQFPAMLSSHVCLPPLVPLERDHPIHATVPTAKTQTNSPTPNAAMFPFIFFGSTILRNVEIYNAYNTVSCNLSENFNRYWPTNITNNVPRIELDDSPVTETLAVDLTFFEKLYAITAYMEDYTGMIVIEANIQELLQDSGDQTGLVYKLARGFLYGLKNWRNRPENLTIVGGINSLPGKLQRNGKPIAIFNALIKTFSEGNNICFLDPTDLAAKTVLTESGNWVTYRPTGGWVPIYYFDTAGEKTQEGRQNFQNWLHEFVHMTKNIAKQLHLPLRRDMLED